MDGRNGNGNVKVNGDSIVDYDKLVSYYQRVTEHTADALELLIERAAEFLSSDELEDFREQLDKAREHMAGWKGPMRFLTRAEASRYVEHENQLIEIDRRDNRNVRLMKMVHEDGCVTVLV